MMLTKNIVHLIIEMRRHRGRDRIIQGVYWDGHRGCFIGCIAKGNNPEFIENQYGVPAMVERIGESIFECLPSSEAPDFAVAVTEAIAVDNKDLSLVGWQFLASMLRRLPGADMPHIATVTALLDRVIAGERVEDLAEDFDRAARAAADAAADAAAVRAADAAAWVAVRTAVRTAAWAAWAAAAAADATADAAARAAEVRAQRDDLLRLLRDAPIKQESA